MTSLSSSKPTSATTESPSTAQSLLKASLFMFFGGMLVALPTLLTVRFGSSDLQEDIMLNMLFFFGFLVMQIAVVIFTVSLIMSVVSYVRQRNLLSSSGVVDQTTSSKD